MAVTTITFTYRGEDPEKTANFKVNLSAAITIGNAAIFAQELAKKADAITDGQLLNISMSTDVSLPAGIRTAPVDGSRVEAKGAFYFRTVNGYSTSMAVPTRDEAIVIDGTHLLDVGDEGVVDAFVDAIIDGIDLTTATPVAGTGTVGPVDTHADSIAVLRRTKEIFE